LIANTFFNDTFNACVLFKNGPSGCTDLTDSSNWRKDGIAWSSDLSKKFIPRALAPGETNMSPVGKFALPPVNDEDFVVWMRTAGLPTFKKLYRRNPSLTLNPGDILSVNISNNFPVSGFSGQKAIVLSTTSWMGGKNDFLGIAYLVVGSLCMVLGIAFFLKHWFCPRNLGDTTFLKQPAVANH